MYLKELQDIEAILWAAPGKQCIAWHYRYQKLCFMAEISMWSTHLCGLMKHAVTIIIHSTRNNMVTYNTYDIYRGYLYDIVYK